MYKLYYSPGACSLAIHTILNELGQPFELIKKADVADYAAINPTGTVPVLVDGDLTLREGASIVLYLLDKHTNRLLPTGPDRARYIDAILFANATVHPAYSKMFFSASLPLDDAGRMAALEAGAKRLAGLWSILDAQLAQTPFVCGDTASAADILLSVYANWGQYFPLEIPLGANVKRMLKQVSERESFHKALQSENVEYKAAE